MFTRLRSTSLGSLIELAGVRSEPSSPEAAALRQSTGATLRHVPVVPSPLSGGFTHLGHQPPPSHAQLQRDQALDATKKAFTEIVESIQQAPRGDLAQIRALLATLLAFLADTPQCRDCMKDNAGFLTLLTVLASLTPPPLSYPLGQSGPSACAGANGGVPGSAGSSHDSVSSAGYSPSLGVPPPSTQSQESSSSTSDSNNQSVWSEEDRDSVVELVFKCLSTALTNHRQNQRFFSTSVGFKLVLDAIRLSALLTQPNSHSSLPSSCLGKQRPTQFEWLFGILFAFIVSDFSFSNLYASVRIRLEACNDFDQPLEKCLYRQPVKQPFEQSSSRCESTSTTSSVPRSHLDVHTKYEVMSRMLQEAICDRAKSVRVEVGDAVLLFFSLHADLLLSSRSGHNDPEAVQELYFLVLKSIELLVRLSRHNQIILCSIQLTGVLLERLVSASGLQVPFDCSRNEGSHHDQLPFYHSAGLEPWPCADLQETVKMSDPKPVNKFGHHQCHQATKGIIHCLLEVGSSTHEARIMFRQAVLSTKINARDIERLNDVSLELILLGMQNSSRPPFIHFGGSGENKAYAILPSLGHTPFPPLQGNGWTFACWIQIESFGTSNEADVELLTISDLTLRCFVSITITSFSTLLVQTSHLDVLPGSASINSSQAADTKSHGFSAPETPKSSASIRTPEAWAEFVGVTFQPDRFYHLALVHLPGTKTSAPNVTLYIDGTRTDTLPIAWPLAPRSHPVSVCFGDHSFPLRIPSSRCDSISSPPRDRSPVRPESQSCSSPGLCNAGPSPQHRARWSLGACWLFNQSLSGEMLFVQSTLGPKTFSCFQDALGSFQTYTSSTLLNLKIDQIHPENSQALRSGPKRSASSSRQKLTPSDGLRGGTCLSQSPLIRAIKEAASTFVPSKSIYFALSARNGIVVEPQNYHKREWHRCPSRCPKSLRMLRTSIETCSNRRPQVHAPFTIPSSDHQDVNRASVTCAPTSSAFGPGFFNGVLNAAIPNFKGYNYEPGAESYWISPSISPSSHSISSLVTPSSLVFSGVSRAHMVLELCGDVIMCAPKGLDDSIWKVSGSIYLVRLVELATTEKQLVTTLKIFFEATRHNWRLSEDAEKIQAYETLGLVLRSKANLITPPVHDILMRLAGIVLDGLSTGSFPVSLHHAKPTDYALPAGPPDLSHETRGAAEDSQINAGLRQSVITNPLAFRFLLLDLDLWSSTNAHIQSRHFQSLSVMFETSVYSRFSLKRISRMNVIPKMLRSLRTQQFSTTLDRRAPSNGGTAVMPAFIKLLSCILRAQFNSESIRHLASYLTSSLSPHYSLSNEPRSTVPKSKSKPALEHSLLSNISSGLGTPSPAEGLTVPPLLVKPLSTSLSTEEPMLVLAVLHDLLLSPNDQESLHYISRFLRAINGPRWLLMFFRNTAHPDVIMYSLRILTRLVQTQDLAWLQHFRSSLAGFTILRAVLSKFCFRNASVFLTVLSLISQVDIRTIPVISGGKIAVNGLAVAASDEDFPTVIKSIQGTPHDVVSLELMPILITLLKPAYVNRSTPLNMTTVHLMDWMTSRIGSREWMQVLGDQTLVTQWADPVLLLSCLADQTNLTLMSHTFPSEGGFTASQPTVYMDSLESFPLRLAHSPATGGEIPAHNSARSSDHHDLGHPPALSSDANAALVVESSPRKSRYRRTSRFHSASAGTEAALRITVPQLITLEGEAIPLTSSTNDHVSPTCCLSPTTLPANRTAVDEVVDFAEDPEVEAGRTCLFIYSYDDAHDEVVHELSKSCKALLASFVRDSPSSNSKQQVQGDRADLRTDRIEMILDVVLDRDDAEPHAWLASFVEMIVEIVTQNTTFTCPPIEWLLTLLRDGYLTGWLTPSSPTLSGLVTFVVDRAKVTRLPMLGDVLLVALAHRSFSSPQVLLEQLCSHRLADLISMSSNDWVPRMVYILTQYVTKSDQARKAACDVLKLMFSYQPGGLEEFSLDIDFSQSPDNSSDSLSPPAGVNPETPSKEKRNNPYWNDNASMSKAEQILVRVLQMGPEELKACLDRETSSLHLAGKLNWIQFVTESEVDAGRKMNEKKNASMTIWREYRNRMKIERKRLDQVIGKLEVWARGVGEIDATRFAHLRQDYFDNKHYLEMHFSKRVRELYRPCSLLSRQADTTPTCWALDSTEGPPRQRRKLRRISVKVDPPPVQQPKARHHRMRSLETSRRDSYRDESDTIEDRRRLGDQSPTSPTGTQHFGQLDSLLISEVDEETSENQAPKIDVDSSKGDEKQGKGTNPPKNEASGSTLHLVSSQRRTGRHENEDCSQLNDQNEDKFRRICKSLEAGDVIQNAWNVEQVVGLDTCPALFLIAKNNIYIIDGFFQKPDGEIVNSWDAWEYRDTHLKTLANLSRQTVKLQSRAAAHQTRRWAYDDIVSVSPRKWLFRDICIELSFSDGRSRLLTFSDTRDEALKRLRESLNKIVGPDWSSSTNFTLKSQTELWQNGQLSNHAYLLYLNDAAGRTYRDLTQHPVFPWILADYTSPVLDLENPEAFRKLKLPMGAQSEARMRDFMERYSSLEEFGAIGDERMKPAHYMTHYSSAVVVCGFLIRLQPFCDHFLEIQGSFDHADRTFWSIHRAWLSASEQSRSDVRELTPEFYHCPEFLKNMNKLRLGSRQEGGDPIGDVQLPPWAHGDPRLFVELHREALESDYVSANLHNWIDLIFGYKQRGQASLDAVNVFQEVSYEGTVSLDAIDDERERSSVLGAMCNWGLTPSQIFQAPHPARARQAKHAFQPRAVITEETCIALTKSLVAIRDIQEPIGQIFPSKILERTAVSRPQSLLVPPGGTHCLDWGFLDQTLRMFDSSGALCATFEGVSCENISSACFADPRTLLTGSTDSTISLWRFAWVGNSGAHLQQVEVLRGHSAPVTCIAASRTFSIVVSGAEDGMGIVWDLNRTLLVHCLPHPAPVSLVAISPGTGDLATCSQNKVRVWSINGDLLSTVATSQHVMDNITACCWSAAEVKPLLVTGHRGGKMMFWQRRSDHAGNPRDPWKMKLVHTVKQESSYNDVRGAAEICALEMTERVLLSGDAFGRLFCWALPGSAYHLPDGFSAVCMLCGYRFGILDGRRRCVSCSAILCSSCQDSCPGLSGKCCLTCLPILNKLVPMYTS